MNIQIFRKEIHGKLLILGLAAGLFFDRLFNLQRATEEMTMCGSSLAFRIPASTAEKQSR